MTLSPGPDAAAIAQARGLKVETVVAAGLRRVSRNEAAARLGMPVKSGGILIPYPGSSDYCRVRLDAPYQAPGWDKPAKYLSPVGAGNRLYLPPNLPDRALQGTERLVITEGEFKALRACEALIPCIATAGIWSWKQKGPDGERQADEAGILPDFNRIAWKGRELVVLVYDSDIDREHPGYEAYLRLAELLRRRGVKAVKILTLPPVLKDGKTGLDDFLNAGHTAQEFWRLADRAPTWGPAFEVASLPAHAPLADVEQALRFLALRVKRQKLDPLARGIVREEALRALERLNVSSPARLIDAALGRPERDEQADDLQGQAVSLSDPEPWPEPVDGAALLDELVATLRRYVVLPSEHHARAIALWVLHTHAIDAAQVTPRLAITSPTKRCGKSTLLAVLGALVRRPLPAANITPAALFRGIEQYAPTVLVDEGDTFLGDRDELRGLLNAGHYRPSAWVIRTVGDHHDVRQFFVFAPVAIGLIGNLPDTLMDRSVRVEMRRREPGEHVEPLRLDRLTELEPLRRKAARWAADHLEALKAADPPVPDGLHDRAADNWRPLLAIAGAAGGPWPEWARDAARVLEQVPDDEDGDARVQLLADLKALFEERGAEVLETKAILEALHDMDDRPWAEWSRGQPMTAQALARLLKPFGIRPFKEGQGPKEKRTTVRGYRRQDFEPAWARYLPTKNGGSKPTHPTHQRDDALSTDLANRHTADGVSLQRNGANPLHDGGVSGVSDVDPHLERGDAWEPPEALAESAWATTDDEGWVEIT